MKMNTFESQQSNNQSLDYQELKCQLVREREALAQTQEPVSDDIASILACRDMLDAQPVPPRTWVGSGDLEDSNAYLTPPQRTWVGLDEVEIVGCTCECIDVGEFNMSCAIDFARAIEAKLKERNTNGQA
jgi:hypothetical protein